MLLFQVQLPPKDQSSIFIFWSLSMDLISKQSVDFVYLFSRSYRVKLLLQAGVDVNSGDGAESDNKVLHWAASFADVEIVRLLIRKTCF